MNFKKIVMVATAAVLLVTGFKETILAKSSPINKKIIRVQVNGKAVVDTNYHAQIKRAVKANLGKNIIIKKRFTFSGKEQVEVINKNIKNEMIRVQVNGKTILDSRHADKIVNVVLKHIGKNIVVKPRSHFFKEAVKTSKNSQNNDIVKIYRKDSFGNSHSLKIGYNHKEKKYFLNDPVRKIRTYSEDNSTKKLALINDKAAVDAHMNMAKVYDFYHNVFGRKSFDNHGSLIKQTVYGDNELLNLFGAMWHDFNNEFEFGSTKIKGKRRIPLSCSLSVVGHEFTHAVIHYAAGLKYNEYPQTDALIESLCDIFGTSISNNWVTGAELKNKKIMRSLSEPTKYGHPDHFSNYKKKKDPHSNAGIHNKAAYLLGAGGKHHGISVKGIGRKKVTKIYYWILVKKYLKPNANFRDMRKAAIKVTTELYGARSSEVQSVKNAYTAVGIK